jgi:hypothetical protein
MNSRYRCRGVLIFFLSLALATPARAKSLQTTGEEAVAAVAAVVAVFVVIVTVVAIHYSKKRTITGCVRPGQNGMIVSDEKDKLVYTLSGDTAGVRADERMTLQGKKIKPNAGNPLGWEITKIRTDYGVCQP